MLFIDQIVLTLSRCTKFPVEVVGYKRSGGIERRRERRLDGDEWRGEEW